MNEKKKLEVPAHLFEAAKEMQTNLAKRSHLCNEKSAVLDYLGSLCRIKNGLQALLANGDWDESGWDGDNADSRYRIDPDVEIVAVKSQEWWQEKGFILCKVEKIEKFYFHCEYPLEDKYTNLRGLPSVLHCEGYDFLGWAFDGLFNQISDIHNTPLLYYSRHKTLYREMHPNSTPVTASWSVWKKKQPSTSKPLYYDEQSDRSVTYN